jgi:rhodanese-related sulfurtransferase
VDAVDLAAFLAQGKGTLIDVRQTIEYGEWRVQPSVNVPYAVPDPNVLRRVVGYAISIKGGLKVRNPEFVEACVAAVGNRRTTVVVIDTKGGDLDVEPTRTGSGTLDATDSSALRAAFELCQAGFADVRYARGGLPGAIEAGGFEYESEQWGEFLRWLDTWNPDQRRLLMYSRWVYRV